MQMVSLAHVHTGVSLGESDGALPKLSATNSVRRLGIAQLWYTRGAPSGLWIAVPR